MANEIIVKDSITIAPVQGDIYTVSAIVTTGTRSEGLQVSCAWNSASGSAVASSKLIEAYQLALNPPKQSVEDALKDAIGTELIDAGEIPENTGTELTINAASVTIVDGGV